MNPTRLEIKWFLYHFDQPCFYKEHFGFECPGCGFQRALYKLLHGQVCTSIRIFPALIPLVILFIFLIIHIIFKLKHGSGILIVLFIINVTLIAGNYLIKLTF
jgi:hypothetical protein